jgi:hypothetical protein
MYKNLSFFSHCRDVSIDRFAELQVQDKYEAEAANVEEKMNVGMYEISQSLKVLYFNSK